MKTLYLLILFSSFALAQNSTETYKEYHTNGQLKLSGEIIDLKELGKSKIGDWKYFNEKGVLTDIYTFHPFSQNRPTQIKRFKEKKLINHIVNDIARYQEFQLNILSNTYTLYKKSYDKDSPGKILSKVEVIIDNEKLIAVNKAISESYKLRIVDFRYLLENAIFTDYKFIRHYYNGDIYLGYKNYITGDVSLFYMEYKTGQIKETGNILNGEFTSYHKNGQISKIGKYKNGSRTGLWKEYDENGKLLNKERM